MKRILIPVDGSDAALRAVQAAINMVNALQTRPDVHLITVQPPIVSGNVTRFFTADMIEDYYQEEGDVALASAKQRLDDAGIPYNDRVLVGPIAPTIIDHVEEQGCDHIFMGTRGLGSLSSMVLGSVTNKVISLTPVPVTLVP